MPTLMGYDSDHPMSEGEVGREGVADRHARRHGGAVRRHRPREDLGVDDDQSDAPGSCSRCTSRWREKRGYDLNKLSGTIQADILKEYMAQKEWIFPIAPSVRIVRDCITYCAREHEALQPDQHLGLPHLRGRLLAAARGGVHDVRTCIVYVEEVTKTGMHVDEFAPRLAFFFVCQARLLRGDRQVPRGAARATRRS